MSDATRGPTAADDRRAGEPPRGILDSLRTLLDTALDLVHTRAELASTELEEEITRLVRVLLWALAAVLAAIVGAAFVGTMVLMAVDPERRVLTAGILGALFLIFAGVGYAAIRRIMAAKPRPMDATLRELEKDREHLRRHR